MAILDYASYVSKTRAPFESPQLIKTVNSAGNAGYMTSLWKQPPTGTAGATPGAPAVPTRATAGALGQFNGGTLRLLQAIVGAAANSANPNNGVLFICDRLSHQSGLSGTALGAQVTNLPTAALTRYTTGVGVQAAFEIYAGVGAAGQTITASYTNTTPTAGQTSQAIAFGGSGYQDVARFLPIPLQLGDTGVVSVESATLSGSTTGAGDFGVTLFKTLAMFPLLGSGSRQMSDAVLNWAGLAPQILTDACLFGVMVCNTAGRTPDFSATFIMGED
jgi:hypothetical protein